MAMDNRAKEMRASPLPKGAPAVPTMVPKRPSGVQAPGAVPSRQPLRVGGTGGGQYAAAARKLAGGVQVAQAPQPYGEAAAKMGQQNYAPLQGQMPGIATAMPAPAAQKPGTQTGALQAEPNPMQQVYANPQPVEAAGVQESVQGYEPDTMQGQLGWFMDSYGKDEHGIPQETLDQQFNAMDLDAARKIAAGQNMSAAQYAARGMGGGGAAVTAGGAIAGEVQAANTIAKAETLMQNERLKIEQQLQELALGVEWAKSNGRLDLAREFERRRMELAEKGFLFDLAINTPEHLMKMFGASELGSTTFEDFQRALAEAVAAGDVDSLLNVFGQVHKDGDTLWFGDLPPEAPVENDYSQLSEQQQTQLKRNYRDWLEDDYPYKTFKQWLADQGIQYSGEPA